MVVNTLRLERWNSCKDLHTNVLDTLASKLRAAEIVDGNGVGRKPLYDDRAAPSATPDVVMRRGGQTLLVADAKYKDAEDRNDINQVVTYAATYRAAVVVLILPAEAAAARGLSLVGTIGGISVYRYRYDLAAVSLESESQDFADALSALLPILAGHAA